MAHRRPGRPHTLRLPLPWAEIEALLRAGEVSMEEMGRRYGVTPQSLRYWARKWGLPPRWGPKQHVHWAKGAVAGLLETEWEALGELLPHPPAPECEAEAVAELREARTACEAAMASLREALGRLT